MRSALFIERWSTVTEIPFRPIQPGESPLSDKRFSLVTKELERELFYQRIELPEDLVGSFTRGSIKFEREFDIDFFRELFRMQFEVLKEPLGHSTEVRYYDVDIPASWWQHYKMTCKDDVLSRWILRRWPVKYRTKSFRAEFRIEHAAIYPEANVAFPALGRAIPYHKIKEST
jgi:hypothetical protein